MREFYAGISSHRIQDWLNNNQQHFKMKPVFLNKDELKPVSAKAPMERLQIDLVDFFIRKIPSQSKTIFVCLFPINPPLSNKPTSFTGVETLIRWWQGWPSLPSLPSFRGRWNEYQCCASVRIARDPLMNFFGKSSSVCAAE